LIFTRVASRAASRFVCRASEGTTSVEAQEREKERERERSFGSSGARARRNEEENEKKYSASLTASHRGHSACQLGVCQLVLRYTQFTGFPSFAPINFHMSPVPGRRNIPFIIIFNSQWD